MAPVTSLGPYRLVQCLARGGMAEIFFAKKEGPQGFSRDLVVKRILPHLAQDPAFTAMFLEEARIASQLSHPNVVNVYDFGEVAGAYYLAMELVRGVDLRSLIARCSQRARAKKRPGAIPFHHAAKILSFAAEGLAHVHMQTVDGVNMGLVHRDVTPSNVLISFDGAVKLADFGIAKAEWGSRALKTRHGVVKGKQAYMSPEQARGEKLDARSDIFNLGILLFEAVTGTPLYPQNDFQAAMNLIAAGVVPGDQYLAIAPPELATIVRRCLSSERDKRYATALEVRADLEAFLRSWTQPSDAVEIGRFVREIFRDLVEADARSPRAAGTVPHDPAGSGQKPAPVAETIEDSRAHDDEPNDTRDVRGMRASAHPPADVDSDFARTRTARRPPKSDAAILAAETPAAAALKAVPELGPTRITNQEPSSEPAARQSVRPKSVFPETDYANPVPSQVVARAPEGAGPVAGSGRNISDAAKRAATKVLHLQPLHLLALGGAMLVVGFVGALLYFWISGSREPTTYDLAASRTVSANEVGTDVGSPSAVANELGQLRVETMPPGLEVAIDGRFRGVTPVSLTVPAGRKLHVQVRNGATQVLDRELELRPGEYRHLDLVTEFDDRPHIQVVTIPAGAAVVIDGQERGKSPVSIGVAVGMHRVRVALPGHQAQDAQLQLTHIGQQGTLSFRLVPEVDKPRAK